MNIDATSTSFAFSIAAIACVSCLLLPHLLYTIKNYRPSKRKYQALVGLYEDEDGQATEASQAAFSDLFQRLALIVASAAGLALAAASAVLTLTRHETSTDSHLVIQQWLQFGNWVSGLWSRTHALRKTYG